MVTLVKKILRRGQYEWDRRQEGLKLARLYSPDPSNLDIQAHISEAMAWLERAQDAGTDRGVSYGVQFGSDFQASYPETTGYICQTFVQMAKRTGDQELFRRAVEMGQWEVDIQLPDGAVMGGQYNQDPTPAMFNTGMVLLGWAALIRANAGDPFRTAATRASDWMVHMQEPDGNWIKGNSQYASGTTIYNVKAAWGLCEAGLALDRPDFVQAALKNAEYCMSRQNTNGWFRDCCLDDPERPLLHTIAYTIQGLLEIGLLTGRKDIIAAAQKAADAEISILQSGFLPGRQDQNFESTVPWSCLTGIAQTSICWSKLHAFTGDSKYKRAAEDANRYLMAHHDIRNSDPRIRGGLAGSWPVDGEYGRLLILNWATKFLVDALALEVYPVELPQAVSQA